jgi:hypothetical protein
LGITRRGWGYNDILLIRSPSAAISQAFETRDISVFICNLSQIDVPIKMAVLKYMDKKEDHMVRSKGSSPCDFGLMWEELGLDRRA